MDVIKEGLKWDTHDRLCRGRFMRVQLCSQVCVAPSYKWGTYTGNLQSTFAPKEKSNQAATGGGVTAHA